MIQRYRVGAVLGAAAALAALALSAAPPALAAGVPGWRAVFTRHYGPAANFTGYTAVISPARNDSWAFGGSDLTGGSAPVGGPIATHWTGGKWRASRLPAGLRSYILVASAPSANDIWAVTGLGGYVLHWNGARWSLAKHVAGSGEFTGVTALGPKNVWVFGAGGFIGGLGTWHYNGRSWTKETAASKDGLATASAVSAKDIWAIGGSKAPDNMIYRYNGRAWKAIRNKTLSGQEFRGILATSDSDVWVSVGNSGTKAWLVHRHGTTWTRVYVPWALDLGSVTADGHGRIYVAAQGSSTLWELHRTRAGHWTRIQTPALAVSHIPGAAGLWAAGSTRLTPTGSDAVIWAHGRVG
jgi:hypothetical protein